MMVRLTLLSYILIISVSCNLGKQKSDDKQDGRIKILGDTIVVSENSPLFSKINLYTVKKQAYKIQCMTTGTVKTLSGCLAEISSPFEGRIVKSFVKLGQKVSVGTPIFEINAPQYFELVKLFVQANQEKRLATNNFLRQKDLLDNRVGSKKDFDEAETACQIAINEYEKLEESLKIFNVKPDEISMVNPLIVRSPISGEIVRNNLTVGQYLKVDADPVVTVADLSKVFVVAHVKEKNIGILNEQDEVLALTEANPDQPVYGFINYIGNMMDEQTRSVEVYVECANQGKMLKPGMFATVIFTQNLKAAMVIPSTAVLQEEDHCYLFVKTGEGRFVRKQVTVTSDGEKIFIVHTGVSPGDVIVAEGGVYLR
jgi:cobalt-zinc-cadmium efflux system membrane fusion protein